MNEIKREVINTIGLRLPLMRALSSRHPVILMYHGVPRGNNDQELDAESFERQILFLKHNVELISPDYLENKRSPVEKIQVLLTFDDGLRNHAEVVAPILRKHQVPAVFFVSSRHANRGKYLWFNYLRMLLKFFRANGFLFGGEFMDMSTPQRQSTIERLVTHLLALKPHPSKMYQVIEDELPRLEDFVNEDELNNHCAGMTTEQVEELAHYPLFSIGCHTIDHPYLTKCLPEEIRRQVADNMTWIENITKQKCSLIAYPGGHYDARVLECCRKLGFSYGFSVERKLSYAPQYQQLQRVGIFSRSIKEVRFKVQWGNLARALRLGYTTDSSDASAH